MNGLSLCAGVGGLDYGVKIAFPGFRTVAAVENNAEAARRFRLRFPEAKVFENVVGFDGFSLHSLVDAVLAGWPCQPHSVAGRRLGTSDERWIWDDIARILRECGAPLFFGENVSGLLRDADSDTERTLYVDDASDDSIGGMGTVLRDLAALGFAAEWGSLRASDVEASHGRPRVFIFACRADLVGSGILAHRKNGGFGINRRAPRRARHAEFGNGNVDDAEHAQRRQEDEPGNGAREGGDIQRKAPGSARIASRVLADAGSGRPRQLGDARDETSAGIEHRFALGRFGNELADAGQDGRRIERTLDDQHGRDASGNESDGRHRGLADAGGAGSQESGSAAGVRQREAAERSRAPVEDAARLAITTGRSGRRRGVRAAGDEIFAPGPSDPRWPAILNESPLLAPALSPVEVFLALAIQPGAVTLQKEVEPQFRGLATRVASWLHERRVRLQADGNLVVPLQAAACFVELAKRLGLV